MLGGPTEIVLPALRLAVSNTFPPPPDVIRAIGMLGAEAAPAVPDLIRAAWWWRRRAGQHDELTRTAIVALGRVGPAAKEALPLLADYTRNRLFEEEAREAIRRIAREK